MDKICGFLKKKLSDEDFYFAYALLLDAGLTGDPDTDGGEPAAADAAFKARHPNAVRIRVDPYSVKPARPITGDSSGFDKRYPSAARIGTV